MASKVASIGDGASTGDASGPGPSGAGRTGSETVVWDDDYNFDEQRFGAFPDWKGPKAVALKKGEKISVTCTYDQSGFGKRFGDSTTDEMCFAISYVTPAINTLGGSAFCPF